MNEKNEKLSIKDWAEADRPREKMLHKGASVLSDAELIAILIGSGNHEETAVELAQRILHSVNHNLNLLAKQTIQDLSSSFKGIGEAKAIAICAALELGKRRGAEDTLQREQILCSRDAFKAMEVLLRDLPHEELWVILTNQANRILKRCKISQGGISATAADVRLILKAALLETASGLILCHNHPSGQVAPSQNDNNLTLQVKQAAQIMNLRLLDHIIVAEGKYYSYADEGNL